MRRAWTLAMAAATLACGSRPSLPTALPPATSAPVRAGEIALAVRHRETDGRVAAGLFVRATEGTAGVRAVAGLVVGARTGVRARATPDGLVLTTSGEASALVDALSTLARALSVRDATASEVEAALAHVRARRAGRSHDDRGLAQRLAVEALANADLDPFGVPEDDTAITTDAVSAWLSGALGAERALVVLVGDLDPRDASEAVTRAFEHAPHAAVPVVHVPAWDGGSARVAFGDHAFAAAATTAATLDEASRLAAWVSQLVPSARATAFPLHGRTVVVATREGDEASLASLASALRHAHRLDEEAPTLAALSATDEVLAVGDAWLADPTGETSDHVGLALVRTGDDDAPPHVDATLDRLAVIEREHARTSDDRRGESTLSNGLRVRVARVDGDEVAVAIAWTAGAALDPAREHGRTALLAAVVARSCAPDADAAWIDAQRFGVVVRGDRASLERTVLRAIGCARRSRSEIEHTEGVRSAAIAAIDLHARMRAWAATVLAPGTPGLVAPRGSAAGIAAATELDDALEDAIDARRATLVIAADATPDHLLDVADSMGSALERGDGALAVPAASPVSGDDAFATALDLDAPFAVVALRSDAGASALAATFVATALGRALAAQGLVVRATWGGTAMATSLATVLVSGPDAALDALPATTRAALAAITAPTSLATDAAAAARTHALSLADPVVLARHLATESPPDTDPIATARALLSSTPRFVMVRPRAR